MNDCKAFYIPPIELHPDDEKLLEEFGSGLDALMRRVADEASHGVVVTLFRDYCRRVSKTEFSKYTEITAERHKLKYTADDKPINQER